MRADATLAAAARWCRRSALLAALCSSGLAAAQGSARAQAAGATQGEDPSLSSAHEMSLTAVLARARGRSPAVRAALATLDRVESEQRVASAAYRPQLTAEGIGGGGYSNQLVVPGLPRVISTSMRAQVGATLDWAALDFERGARVQERRAASLAQAAAKETTQLEVVRDAAILYVRALAATQLVADARLTLERRASQLQTVSALVEAGMRPSVDVVRAQIEVTQAQSMLEVQALSERAAMAALAAAIGADPATLVRPQPLEGDPLQVSLLPDEVGEVALTHRPELRQLAQTVSAREAAHRATLGARLPKVGITGAGTITYLRQLKDDQFSITGSQYEAYGGVYARWTALDAVTWRTADVARHATAEAIEQRALFTQNIHAEAVEAAYLAQRARAQHDLSAQLLAATEVARKAQNERYAAGIASLLELLDAEELAQSARRRRIEAEREHHIARLRLLAACGLIDRLTR